MRNAIDLTPIDFKQWPAKEWGRVFYRLGTSCRRYRKNAAFFSCKLMGLYYVQLSTRSRLVPPTSLRASYCLRYGETQQHRTSHIRLLVWIVLKCLENGRNVVNCPHKLKNASESECTKLNTRFSKFSLMGCLSQLLASVWHNSRISTITGHQRLIASPGFSSVEYKKSLSHWHFSAI